MPTHTVAERTRAEHLESGGGTVDWAVITAGLCARFAPTRNDLDLIDKLRSVEQGAGSVATVMDKRRCAYHFLNSTSMNVECIKVCTYSKINDSSSCIKFQADRTSSSLSNSLTLLRSKVK
jgi:hypothetical protein